MKVASVLFTLVLLVSALYAQPNPPVLWSHNYAAAGGAQARAVCQMTDGSYVIAGLAGSAGDYDGACDGYVIKVDADGDTLWTRRYDNGDDDRFFTLQAMPEGGFVVVGFTMDYAAYNNDFWVLRCDAAGEPQWTTHFGGWLNDQGYAICPTSDGGLAVAGIDGTSGAGRYEESLAKLDLDGNVLWQHGYGVPAINVESRSVHECLDGGFIVSGGSVSYGSWNAPFNMFVIRTDADGEAIWQRQYGAAGSEFATDAICMDDSGFVIVGYTTSRGHGGADISLIRVNANGAPVYSRVFGGAADDAAYEIRHTSDGGFLIGGVTASAGHGSDDLLLLKLDDQAHRQWARVYGTPRSDFPWSNSFVEFSSDGGYVLAGTTVAPGGDRMLVIRTGSDQGANFVDPNDLDVPEIAEEILSANPAPAPISSYALLPNYPNPFNPTTVIPFELAKAGHVSLKIFDMLGQEVATLVSGNLTQGYHEVTFDASALPSGVYFSRIVANGFSAEHKLMLIK